MNKNIIVLILVSLFLVSFVSAWTSSEFIKDDVKSLDKITNFGTYKIEKSSWYDPLGIWTKETLKEIELKTNTETCVDCLSEGTIVLNKDGTLIDDLIWKRSFDEGKTFVDWNGFTNWRLLVEEDIDVYETTCIDGKEIIDEKNGTSYFEQDCITSKVGTTKQWNSLDFKKTYSAGTYNYKIEGSKKASVIYDWIIKTDGKVLDEWAVWGAVIGEGGVEASVTLNSPADSYIQYVNPVTLNASANVTGGAYLTNATLYDNSTGTWGARNSSTPLGIEVGGLVTYYKLDETSGTKMEDITGNHNGSIQGATINQIGKIDKSYFVDATKVAYTETLNFSKFEKIGTTINLWYYWNGTNSSDGAGGFFFGGYGSHADFSLYLRGGNNFYRFDNPGGLPAGNNWLYNLSSPISANTWYMVTLTRNTTHTVMYHNSVYLGTIANINWLNNIINISVGMKSIYGFNGRIDEFGVFERALTQSEVTTLYNSEITQPITQTFTNTYPSGSNILWNMQFCDSDGDCGFATSNRIFSMDNVAPTITLNYPTALIDYGKLNGTLQLNFTTTDVNLDSCWYQYNNMKDLNYHLDNPNRPSESIGYGLNGMTNSDDYLFFYNNKTFVNTEYIKSLGFILVKVGSPTGQLNISIFNGSTGTRIATKEVDISLISTSAFNKEFTNVIFDSEVEVIGSIFLGLEYFGSKDSENNIRVARINTIPNYNPFNEIFFAYNSEGLLYTDTEILVLNLLFRVDGYLSCSSGIPSSFTIPVNNSIFNLYLYANDTTGNQATYLVNWDYKVFENSRTYNESSLVTAIETFKLNITTDGSHTPVVYLVYNNTQYLTTLTSGQYSVDIPILNEGNNTFYWSIHYGSSIINTTQSVQSVEDISSLEVSTTCSAGLTAVVNFTFTEESSLLSLENVTVAYNFQYGISSTTQKVTNGLLANINNIVLCLNLTQSPTYNIGYGEIDYQKNEYSQRRFYVFNNTRLSSSIINNTLYLLNNSESTSFLIGIRDPSLAPYTNRYTSLLRWYPSEDQYKVVEMGKTDDKGQTVKKIKIEDIDYRIGVYELDGTLIYLASPIRMVCLASPCSYSLTIRKTNTYNFDEINNIQSEITYNDGIFTLTYNDPSQNTDMMILRVYKTGGYGSDVPICSSNSTSFTGIITCNVTGNEGILKANAYRASSPEYVISSIIVDTLTSVFQGTFGLFLQLLISLTLIMLGIINPITSIILGVISLVFGVYLFKTLTYPIMVGIAILGGIVIHLMRRTNQ